MIVYNVRVSDLLKLLMKMHNNNSFYVDLELVDNENQKNTLIVSPSATRPEDIIPRNKNPKKKDGEDDDQNPIDASLISQII